MSRPQDNPHDLFDQLNHDESTAMVLTRWQPRLAGLCTAMVLLVWTVGSYASLREVGSFLLMADFGYMMSMQNPPPPPPIKYEGDARTSVIKYREARLANARAYKQRLEDFYALQKRQSRVRLGTTIVWSAVMILAGVMMLCSALSGLMGSRKTRRWHGVAATWILGSTACSGLGIYVLFQWGGFPPPDNYLYLAQKLFMQGGYGLVILVGLLIWRRPQDIADPRPLEQAHISERLREPGLGRLFTPSQAAKQAEVSDDDDDDDEPVILTAPKINHIPPPPPRPVVPQPPPIPRDGPPPIPRPEPPAEPDGV